MIPKPKYSIGDYVQFELPNHDEPIFNRDGTKNKKKRKIITDKITDIEIILSESDKPNELKYSIDYVFAKYDEYVNEEEIIGTSQKVVPLYRLY